MRLFRIILYTAATIGVIACWEAVRGDIYPVLDKVIQGSQVKPKSEENKSETDQPADSDLKKEAEEGSDVQEPKEEKDKVLFSFEKGFEDVAKGAMHSVVNVATMQLIESSEDNLFGGTPFDDILKDFFDFPKRKQKQTRKAHALGSGFIVKVDKDIAYIVTNNHVIEKAKKVVVYLADKTELPAEIHATDQRTDIAVLSINLKSLGLDYKKLKTIVWGDSDNVHEGNWVIAIGNPFGFGSTVTHGIVSAKGRNIASARTSLSLVDDFIQHSAQINMGNSGGCLLDIYGKVIGINNAIFSTSGGNIGIGFAIPSNIAQITVDQLIEHKRTFRGWLGAEIQAVGAKQAESVGLITKTLDSSKIYGAFVARLVPGGPAEKAGVKVGDIITEFNEKKISEKSSLLSIVSTTKIGSDVKVKVWRHKDEKWSEEELSLKVGDFENAIESGSLDSADENSGEKGSKKQDEEIDSLGISVSKIPESRMDQYQKDVKVIVTKVDDSKESSFFGPIFEPGDGIISANNQKVTSVAQFKKIIDGIKNNKELRGKQIPFVINRGKSMMFLSTTIDFSSEKEPEKKKK